MAFKPVLIHASCVFDIFTVKVGKNVTMTTVIRISLNIQRVCRYNVREN